MADGEEGMSVRSVRSDSKRNRGALLQSAGELVRTSGSSVTMNSIAEHAGLSVATAYRHFPSLESVFEAYMFDVAHELRTYSLSLETPGPELLARVARKWIELCLVHGPATVHMRSRRGYLERLHEGADYLLALRDALLRPILLFAESRGLTLGRDGEERALFLWNILFDPREILDLRAQLGLTAAQSTEQLLAAFDGALTRWASFS
jgi:AcrR family transcriptional regulator